MEYLVTLYAVPIHSAVYVWALSWIMASVASLLHLDVRIDSTFFRRITTWPTVVPVLSGAYWICLALPSVWWSQELGTVLPTLALIVAVNYSLYAFMRKCPMCIFSALGWSISCLLIYLADPITRIGLFAFSTVVFSTTPLLCQQIRQQRDIKAALQALQDD